MVIAPLSLQKDYWQAFEITDEDLDFLYNFLLEVEKPQTTQELVAALVTERIRVEKSALEKQREAGGSIYAPKNHYEIGQTLQFPTLDWQKGKVLSVRAGENPDLPPFEVMEVEVENGQRREFAAGLDDHILNQPVALNMSDPSLDPNYVNEEFGERLAATLTEVLVDSPDLVRIAWRWFPRALLVDINAGHLNLAEAVLDMVGGGPLPTHDLMEQIDLPDDVDANLNEFSLNLALQEDKRFDEVGPAGEILWYLHRLEPEWVREAPLVLRPHSIPDVSLNDPSELLASFGAQIFDELEPGFNLASKGKVKEVTLSLIYPHWRAGTLPLVGDLVKLFPTAFESPRIQFTFVDGNSGEKFSGWVVRPLHYVYGLRDWYQSQGLIAGSIVHIQRSSNPGEVIVKVDKKRASKEWVRTAVIGSDGGVVFSMLKHALSAAIDERMGIAVPNVEALDEVWERGTKQRAPLPQTIKMVMREMAKLSPQNHVHAQEIYAGLNILRRCPPGVILAILLQSPWAKHLGNLYFRLDESSGGETA